MTEFRKRIKLGEVLKQKGLVTEEQIVEALKEQKTNEKYKSLMLGEILVNMGFVEQAQLEKTLCEQLNITSIDLRQADFDEDVVHLINEKIARKYCVIPINADKERGNAIRVATVDPLNYMALDDISIITGMMITPVLSSRIRINAAIDKYFGKEQAMAVAEMYRKEQADYETAAESDIRKEEIDNSPIVVLVRKLIEQAARLRASDIHIEPFEYEIKVRFRVDGVLREIIRYDKNLLAAIVSRIKVISGLDISEKRKPQDGRITTDIDNREYDIRVSVLPTVFGEKIVMRLASKDGFKRDKKDLGISEDDMKVFDSILKNPHGIILVTGPTGSGKSTTLYTVLSELSTDEVNIVTVEDPVEANIDGVNQVQVNVKSDLTFSSALRSILRQDPDIIMIGEIRDSETAEIAVKASITGHLVVSTLHTNSTSSTISRLIDMGVEPYLLADSLVGIIAQRLVKRLCNCKTQRLATEDEKNMLGIDKEKEQVIYEPCGCQICNGTGYFGRIGIYEIMSITTELKHMIANNCEASIIQQKAEENGMNTLKRAAAKYVLDGTTSYDEMIRATYEN